MNKNNETGFAFKGFDRNVVTLGCLAVTLLLVTGHVLGEDLFKKSVVKLFVTKRSPDYYQPWTMEPQESLVGSGFIIEGNRVLTNAHVVSDQVYIEVLKVGETKRHNAKVEYVGHDCEVAILKIEDPAFFDGTVPVKFGELPGQGDKVRTYGFPIGGEELSITAGLVSRIEVVSYMHGRSRLLGIQTDAAINPGNSGGPVFKDGEFVGISFQSYSGSEAENVGYVVPVTIVKRFLKDIQDGAYDGIPDIGIVYQYMQGEALRAYYGLKPDQTGVLITKVAYGSLAWGVLQKEDVLISVAGLPIAADGTIPFRENERVNLIHKISEYQVGDKVDLEVLRNDQVLNLELVLGKTELLVPRSVYDVHPTYFIFGGFIFMPLSQNYIMTWNEAEDVPIEYMYYFNFGSRSEERKQVIIITQVLPHDINQSYHGLEDAIVEKINGQTIRKMSDVIEAFEKPLGRYHVIELDEMVHFGWRIILDAGRAKQANSEILAREGISSDRSQDLK